MNEKSEVPTIEVVMHDSRLVEPGGAIRPRLVEPGAEGRTTSVGSPMVPDDLLKQKIARGLRKDILSAALKNIPNLWNQLQQAVVGERLTSVNSSTEGPPPDVPTVGGLPDPSSNLADPFVSKGSARLDDGQEE